MRTLWVHPGLGKAGSSAIQHAASQHLIGESAVGYFPTLPKSFNHHELCKSHKRYQHDFFERGLSQIANDRQDYLLSSELIGGNEVVKKIIELGSNHFSQIKAIIVVRKPSDWFRSLYAQKIKTADYRIGETFDSFVQSRHYPAYKIVSEWQQATMVSPTIVPFTKDSLLANFFRVIGAKQLGLSAARENKNESLKQNQIDWLRHHDKKNGALGDYARLYRKSREYVRLLSNIADSCHPEPTEVMQGTLQYLDELDSAYEKRLSEWRSQRLLPPELCESGR